MKIKKIFSMKSVLILGVVFLIWSFVYGPVGSIVFTRTETIISTGEIKMNSGWKQTAPWFGDIFIPETQLDFGDKSYTSSDFDAVFDIENNQPERAEVIFSRDGVVLDAHLHLRKNKRPIKP